MPYNVEIERKFKCFPDKVPLDLAVNINKVQQFYLTRFDDGNNAEVRVVIRNNEKAEITIKSNSNCEIRDEFSFSISVNDAILLDKLKIGNTIAKERYFIPITPKECLQLAGKAYWEVDVYRGGLYGLVTAEIEFPPDVYDNSIALSLPDWIECDVTGKYEYKNSVLASRKPNE